jgi:formylglycine-generating enzyme required for sulfatase activity
MAGEFQGCRLEWENYSNQIIREAVMFIKKQFRGIAIITLFIFTCFTLTLDYSYSQEENPLLKAQELYKQGNFQDAVKVLEAFIEKTKGNQAELKNIAEAYYLLARMNYDISDDTQMVENLKLAVEANIDIGKEETNLDFKARLDRVRGDWLKSEAKKKEAELVVEKETAKTEIAKPSVQEKEKPAQQIKKKKKFPWLIVGVVLVIGAAALYFLVLNKKYALTVNLGAGATGTPAATAKYKKGTVVSYNYTPQAGYGTLQVKLDNVVVSNSGTFTMNSNHTLDVSVIASTFKNGVLTIGGVLYELASIPAGEFQMGNNSSEANFDEKPVHTVRLSKTFWMGKTEVTQGLWQAVMGSNPSYFKSGDNYPVEQVSWDDCQSFIQKLNQMLGGNAFRMPTEAEWEYACRAGTTGDSYGNIDAIAWYFNNAGNTTHPVGQKQKNAWGLYDTLGNVWEWCQDWYDENYYQNSPAIDPTGPASGSYRVIRGGSWAYDIRFVRSASRFRYDPGYRCDFLGFRLASGSAGG